METVTPPKKKGVANASIAGALPPDPGPRRFTSSPSSEVQFGQVLVLARTRLYLLALALALIRPLMIPFWGRLAIICVLFVLG